MLVVSIRVDGKSDNFGPGLIEKRLIVIGKIRNDAVLFNGTTGGRRDSKHVISMGSTTKIKFAK